jgi:plastocyanin
MRYWIALLVGSVVVTLAWALPAVAHHASPSVGRVSADTVTAGKPSEFHFALTKKSVPKGTVTFLVMNKGNVPHDFKINGHKTRLLSPGQSQTLKVTFLKSGKYPFLCTVTGHAVAGMKGTLTVM